MLNTIICILGYMVVLIIMILLRPRSITPQNHRWLKGLSFVHFISAVIITICLAGLYQLLFLDNDIYDKPLSTGLFLFGSSIIAVIIAHYRFGEYPNEAGFNVLASVVYAMPVAVMLMILVKQVFLVM